MPAFEPLARSIRLALSGAPVEAGEEIWRSEPLHPWFAWLLVALLRQTARQRWLMRVVEERLAEVDDESGEVPGLPGWTFEVHGRGCCLRGPGNEVLDVDFHGDGGLSVDPYFFARRVLALDAPALPEARVRALLPDADLIAEAIRGLRSLGALRHPESDHVFRVDERLAGLVNAADGADFSSPERWARMLGDFSAVPGHPLAERAVEARRSWLLALLDQEATARVALPALGSALPAPELLSVCARVIAGPPGQSTGVAIQVLRGRPELPVCDEISRLLDRMDPDRDHPFALFEAARYLLERGVGADRAIRAFLAFARVKKVAGFSGNPFLSDFALLALEFAPHHALELVRASLRSSTPMVRNAVAAILAGLGHPWCREELLSALRTRSSAGEASELLAALERCRDPEARRAGVRWLHAHPPSPHQGVGFTWEEVALANRRGLLDLEMESRREWIARMRPRLAGRPPAPRG